MPPVTTCRTYVEYLSFQGCVSQKLNLVTAEKNIRVGQTKPQNFRIFQRHFPKLSGFFGTLVTIVTTPIVLLMINITIQDTQTTQERECRALKMSLVDASDMEHIVRDEGLMLRLGFKTGIRADPEDVYHWTSGHLDDNKSSVDWRQNGGMADDDRNVNWFKYEPNNFKEPSGDG